MIFLADASTSVRGRELKLQDFSTFEGTEEMPSVRGRELKLIHILFPPAVCLPMPSVRGRELKLTSCFNLNKDFSMPSVRGRELKRYYAPRKNATF